jgi:hypothetical protein
MRALAVYDWRQLVDIFFHLWLLPGQVLSGTCHQPPENRHVLIEIGSPMRNIWTSSP